MKEKKEKLFTPGYCCMLVANFMLFFGFWLLIPVLPFYLTEEFGCGQAVVGIILCCYTLSALCMRPFSGYLLDSFARKPLYLMAYFICCSMLVGYMSASTLTLFIILRIVHGLAFGTVTVGGSTVVIDILPSSRRGEGLGYFGLTNNLAMSTGPMVGLMMHNAGLSFNVVFACALLASLAGLAAASFVKTPYRPPVRRAPISLDRFVLLKGIPAGIALLMLSVPYGMTTNYVAMYARQIGITAETGLFFTWMAVGMAVSRIFAGRWVDRGYVTQSISAGFYLVVSCFFLLAGCSLMARWDMTVCTFLFFTIPVGLGVGFGVMFPAYNTLFVNLAPNNQRGTATSTYLTSWDVGIGAGMLTGGYISEVTTFDRAYLAGACLTVISMLYFNLKVAPHYHKNKLR